MWPFFKRKRSRTEGTTAMRRRPLRFADLIADMGDFSDLATHDVALKFWLPEPVAEALKDLCGRSGESMSESLRRFFATHCYGVYAFTLMHDARPDLFGEQMEVIAFECRGPSPPGKKREDTYWVPELGKNIVPIKVWIPKRMRADLQTLADHAGIKLSRYVREVIVSRLLGHGALPKRPEMLVAAPLAAAEDWCEGREVPMRRVAGLECRTIHGGERVTEWVDDEPAGGEAL